MAAAYITMRIRIFKRDDQTGLYAAEANSDSGASYQDQLRLDLSKLLGLQYSPREYGLELFYTLFSGRLRRAYDVVSGQAVAETDGRLRVRLQIDDAAPELHALRWETLYHTYRGAELPLAISADTPFSRYNALESAEAKPLTPPLQLLFALANPSDLAGSGLAPLDVEAEIRSLLAALADLRENGKLQVKIMPGRTGLTPALQAELDAAGWQILPGVTSLENVARALPGCHIFHFLGHGAYSQSGEQAALVLEREDENKQGESKRVPDQTLASRLRPLSDLRLVFLAACESARRDTDRQEPNPYVGLAPQLVQAGVPAVVAMQDEVEMGAARQLTGQFYGQLLDHGYVDQALNMARYTLFSDDDKQWTIPVLYMRLADGRLFAPEADSPTDESAGATQPATKHASISHQLMIELRDILAKRFSIEDLKQLVFDMGIDYEDLPGQIRAAKARELVAYCQRRGLIPKLIEVGQQQRPDINWPLIA